METEGSTTTVINSTLTTLLRNCTSLPGGCSGSTSGTTEQQTTASESSWDGESLSHRVNCSPKFDGLCLNNGFCQYIIVGRYKHRFCNCVGTYTGPRCEYFNFAALGGSTHSEDNSSAYIYAGIAVGILLLTIVIAAIYYYLKSRTYKSQLDKLEYVATDGYHSSKETLVTRCDPLNPQRITMMEPLEFYNDDDVVIQKPQLQTLCSV